MVKKLKLEDQNSVDFRGLGIVSPEKDYRLCYLLNNELGFDFDKSVNIAFYDPAKNQRKAVSCYIHNDTDAGDVLYLVKNKQEGFFMVPDMREVDFIFLEPLNQDDSLNTIKNRISKLDIVQSCFVIPGPKLKHIDAE